MNFSEWVNKRTAKQLHELASKKDDEYMMAVIRMAQEDMRERAVSVAKQGFNRALTGDEIADQIQELPIEV